MGIDAFYYRWQGASAYSFNALASRRGFTLALIPRYDVPSEQDTCGGGNRLVRAVPASDANLRLHTNALAGLERQQRVWF